jgi:hypothetical protein
LFQLIGIDKELEQLQNGKKKENQTGKKENGSNIFADEWKRIENTPAR